VDEQRPDQPDGLSRSDMRLIRGSLRQDWPTDPEKREKVVRTLWRYLDPDDEQHQTASDRTIMMAARTLAMYMKLNLGQQSIDLARERFEGRKDDRVSLADLVSEAERRAAAREDERDGEG
jgi:hypothetical protein